MEVPFECIINNTSFAGLVNPGIVLLDFLRRQEHLTGTKEGCREGDCGACTVLVGELRGGELEYRAVNSCLLPLGDVHGKHVVTIEGINQPASLTPIQQAFVDEGGTQCGFCTPGFIISLTGYCLNDAELRPRPDGHNGAGLTMADRAAITAVDGNICRCTGHVPIKKAIRRINEFLSHQPNAGGSPLERLVHQKILPAYFLTIATRLGEMLLRESSRSADEETTLSIVSGGTDLYVQKAFTMHAEPARRISAGRRESCAIVERGGALEIPGTTTIEEFRSSPVIKKYFPELEQSLLLFGSTPIRNRATVAGNLANASPIGDMTCILTALNADVVLEDGAASRVLPLRRLYTGYKQLDKKRTELITAVSIAVPRAAACFSYEKVSRRTHLDIASVNSVMAFELTGGVMTNVGIACGGVGPTMVHLARTSEYMNGSRMDAHVFAGAWEIASSEISPISDARGSAAYKRLLVRQLLAAHIMKYFPDAVRKEAFA